MRRAIPKCPFTDRAQMLIIKELDKIRTAGHDPNAALDQSTAMGWKDVYPPREKSIPKSQNGLNGMDFLMEQEAARVESQTPANRARAQQARDLIQSKLLRH